MNLIPILLILVIESLLVINNDVNAAAAAVSTGTDQYSKIISRADIFYISPEPNTITPEIRISKLMTINNRTNIKIIIHGYLGSINHPSVQPLRFAYLTKGYNTLYMADWSEAAQVFYYASRNFVIPMGKHLAKIISGFIKKHDINPEHLHIIGHSLGAHIAGIVGRTFGGKIGRITGLDPALPLLENNPPDALRKTDAQFVDIIHSGSPVLGIANPIGHIDFYPNYGMYSQPGCSTLDTITVGACSHYRAPLFYGESIQLPQNFPAIRCPYQSIQMNKCDKLNSFDIVMMGEQVSKSARGTFYLETTNVPPYGKGNFSKFMDFTLKKNQPLNYFPTSYNLGRVTRG